MVTTPRVSVIVPAYNVGNYIEEALASLERQSLADFEAIIVDDGSLDDTAKLTKGFCQRDPRFRLVQKPNGGLSSARNFGIKRAHAKYIALLDGDDRYAPDKLSTHVARLDRSADVGVVYSASRAIRNDGRLTFMSLSGKPVKSDPLLALLCKNFIGHGSNAVFRRQVFDAVGEFDETLRSCEDVDFWLRVAATRCWRFEREPRLLSFYRVRPSGLSFDVAQMQHARETVIAAARQRSPELDPVLPTAYAYLYRYLSRLSLTAGDVGKARQFLDRALSADRSIFYLDPRSLLTLLAVRLAPLSQLAIKQSLGSIKS